MNEFPEEGEEVKIGIVTCVLVARCICMVVERDWWARRVTGRAVATSHGAAS